jgi:hypothetical protein
VYTGDEKYVDDTYQEDGVKSTACKILPCRDFVTSHESHTTSMEGSGPASDLDHSLPIPNVLDLIFTGHIRISRPQATSQQICRSTATFCIVLAAEIPELLHLYALQRTSARHADVLANRGLFGHVRPNALSITQDVCRHSHAFAAGLPFCRRHANNYSISYLSPSG